MGRMGRISDDGCLDLNEYSQQCWPRYDSWAVDRPEPGGRPWLWSLGSRESAVTIPSCGHPAILGQTLAVETVVWFRRRPLRIPAFRNLIRLNPSRCSKKSNPGRAG